MVIQFYHCNSTLHRYVYNLTSSYIDQRNELFTLASSSAMFILAALFFTINLYSRSSDLSANLIPALRVVLSTSLSLFLPVMSYLFSEAKNNGEGGGAGSAGQMTTELPARARLILMWMLLVELLRKKVEGIILDKRAGLQEYKATLERASRIGWLAYLVFFNIRSAGKKAFYAILWILAAAKLLQRYVSWEVARHSLAYGKNPRLLASYMAQTMGQEEEQRQRLVVARNGQLISRSELLKRCSYVVMGEEKVVKKSTGPDGYKIESAEAVMKDDSIVTIGKIWTLAETEMLLRGKPQRLCLSFALYKLLRRRLEHFPITAAEARSCHDLIFNGLWSPDPGPDDALSSALFQVLNDEIQFLCEYYHSIHPVVLASPFFFMTNYVLFPIVVCALCVLTIILCSNGDALYALRSFRDDNYAVTGGLVKITICILSKLKESPMALFSVIDISVTILLLLTFTFEEIWGYMVFLLSNWFMVSLLCSYTSKPTWRASPLLTGAIRRIQWVRNKVSQHTVCFKQFCMLSSTPTLHAVPGEAKKSIIKRLCLFKAGDIVPRSNGRLALNSNDHLWLLQHSACDGEGLAEVILTWHIATILLENQDPLAKPEGNRKVATALSGYCTYLVAFCPKLLPDNKNATKHAYKQVIDEMKKEIGCFVYWVSPLRMRQRKLMEVARRWSVPGKGTTTTTVFSKGVMLGNVLMDKYLQDDENQRVLIWKLLADVWTEVLVCAALPTSSELDLKVHKEAMAEGGEFITLLWALATHTGISRDEAAMGATPPESTEATEILIVADNRQH